MSESFVAYDKAGGVVTIRLNRPERMNSLSRALVEELDSAWRAFVADTDARVAVYTGTGKAFCAGMDLKEAAEPGAAEAAWPEPPLTIFHAGEVDKPVIAAVNGYAIGGGFFDVLRCDLRVAAENAIFQLAETERSVLPHPLIEGLAGSLPDCLLTELALSARIDARRAYEMGIVNQVVSEGELMAAANTLADRIAGLPPLAVAGALEGLRRARALRPERNALQEWQAAATRTLRDSDDYREALAAFLEKRQPVYKGR